jgi:hypothetical protein
MRKLPWVVGLVLLSGCRVLSDAFTAHPEVVVRVDDEELTVARLAQLLVLGQSLPLRLDIAEELARHWVDVTALSRRAAVGDSLLDRATVLETMWLERRQFLLSLFREQLFADQVELGPEAVDSAYRVGEMRVLAHVLRRLTPETTPEEKGQQLALALRLRDRLMDGASWQEVNEQNEDETARANNGSLGLVKRGRTVPRFENVAFALAPGELSAVTETQFGYHIIYRPSLEAVRDVFTAFIEEEVAARLDSLYGERLLEEKGVEVRPTAPTTVRKISTDPIRALGSSRVLATYNDGRFTTGQFARWLLYVPVETFEQLLVAPDDQIANLTRQLVLQDLLWQQVDSAGIQMSDSAYDRLEDQYRRGLESVWEVVGVWPDSLAAAGATPADREQIARQRVDRYFEAIAARTVPLRPVPPFLAIRLRQGVDWEIIPAGVNAALQRAIRLRAATARPEPPTESNLP